MKQKKLSTGSPEETQQLGLGLAQHFEGGEVLLLSGTLGAGKTCLTQGLAWGLGVQEHARSPTFVLASEYEGRLTLYHLDLYRLDDLMEIDDLGLDEYIFGQGVCVIEWAEKGRGVLPDDGLTIRIEVKGENDREFTLEAHGERYERLLDRLQSESLTASTTEKSK